MSAAVHILENNGAGGTGTGLTTTMFYQGIEISVGTATLYSAIS